VLAAELRCCAGIDIDHARADHGSIDLSQVVSTEYRADNVAILGGPDGRPVTGVIRAESVQLVACRGRSARSDQLHQPR
jgi:hypothetical protein